MNSTHSCGAGYKDIHHPTITSKVVKAFCIDQVRTNPMIKTKGMMDSFMLEFGSMLKYYIAYSGKGLAIKEIHGDELISFNQLVWYVDALKATNPGSHVVLEIDENKKFRRVFIALQACISGFNHCRPLLMVDGIFLKGKLKGCLMAATAKNANQGNFPVAFVIVLSEDEDNWVWFMDNLKSIIDPSREYVFISDRHWGLIKSIARVFPSSFHSFCLYHLKRNLAASIPSSKKSGSWIVKLFRDIAYAATPDDFNQKWEMFTRQQMKGFSGLYQGLQRLCLRYVPQFLSQLILNKKICSCNMWRINGFPCEHAVRAIMVAGMNVYEFMDPYYLSSSFRASYSTPIHPIPTDEKPMLLLPSPFVVPPDVRRQPGRPSTKRKEGRCGGLKRPITCGTSKRLDIIRGVVMVVDYCCFFGHLKYVVSHSV